MTTRHTDMTDELRDQLTLLALDALDVASADYWHAHLSAGCEVCRHELASIETTLAMLAYSSPAARPPAQLKRRLLARVQGSPPSAAPSSAWTKDRQSSQPLASTGWRWPLAFGVAASLLVATGLYIAMLRADLERYRAQIIALKRQMADREQWLKLWQSPNVSIVIMNGLDPNPQGHGKLIWDPVNRQATLYVTNLPPPPPGYDYQLWHIVDNKPISAGVFAINAHAGGFFNVQPAVTDPLRQASAFAVTLEPQGGVPQPTGRMLLLGKPACDRSGMRPAIGQTPSALSLEAFWPIISSPLTTNLGDYLSQLTLWREV